MLKIMKRKKQTKSTVSKPNRRTRKSSRKLFLTKRKTKRTSRAKNSKRGFQRRRKLHVRRPTTARQYFSMPPKEQETWDSVNHVVARMRHGVSLSKASKEFGIAPSIVVKLGRPALRKMKGQYVATKTDRRLRILTTLTVKGKKEIVTRDSRQASLVGGHWAAVQRYLETGDDSALLGFKGNKVTDASGKRHLLLTEPKELDRLASAGVLSFESIYPDRAR
jgi:hypothetical protein